MIVDINRTIIYYTGMRLKDETKNENIFNATLQLINEVGLSETSMSKIAKSANVSASTIYVYFENKEDLLNKLYLEAKRKMSEEMFTDFDESLPIQTAFEISLRRFTHFILRNKDYFLFIEQFQNSPLLKKITSEESAEYFEPLYRLFEKGKEQKILKQVDTSLLNIFTSYPVMQAAKEHFLGKSELNEDKLNLIVQMTWDSVKA